MASVTKPLRCDCFYTFTTSSSTTACFGSDWETNKPTRDNAYNVDPSWYVSSLKRLIRTRLGTSRPWKKTKEHLLVARFADCRSVRVLIRVVLAVPTEHVSVRFCDEFRAGLARHCSTTVRHIAAHIN